jgi:hypothetical protein
MCYTIVAPALFPGSHEECVSACVASCGGVEGGGEVYLVCMPVGVCMCSCATGGPDDRFCAVFESLKAGAFAQGKRPSVGARARAAQTRAGASRQTSARWQSGRTASLIGAGAAAKLSQSCSVRKKVHWCCVSHALPLGCYLVSPARTGWKSERRRESGELERREKE